MPACHTLHYLGSSGRARMSRHLNLWGWGHPEASLSMDLPDEPAGGGGDPAGIRAGSEHVGGVHQQHGSRVCQR